MRDKYNLIGIDSRLKRRRINARGWMHCNLPERLIPSSALHPPRGDKPIEFGKLY
jgi:hypothetical protein